MHAPPAPCRDGHPDPAGSQNSLSSFKEAEGGPEGEGNPLQQARFVIIDVSKAVGRTAYCRANSYYPFFCLGDGRGGQWQYIYKQEIHPDARLFAPALLVCSLREK